MWLPVGWPAPDLATLAAARVPERPALVDADAGGRWTYRELSTGPVAALAAALRSTGVGPGDHLGVVVQPGPSVAHLLHAAARVGATLVPLAPGAPAGVLAERGRAADVDAVVADGESLDAARVAFDGPVHALEPLLAGGAADGEVAGDPHRWAPDDVRWLVFTSGTTGEPLPVALTARNLVASATASALRLGVDPDDRWLACLPTHHVGGLAPLVRSALYGTAVVVQSGFDAGATARAMADHDVAVVSLVPTMLRRLLDDGWSPPAGLRAVLLGGAAAPPALVERAVDDGAPVCPTYGMTETASQVATATPAEAVEDPVTVGRPLRGTTVEVVDDDGGPVPTGEAGALVVAGPTVAAGYLGAPGRTAERFVDGRFHTRDRGRLDGDGRLRVLGRLDDAIETGGETVHPDRVEAALRAHPGVDDAAVVGLDDPAWGAVVGALVVPAARGGDGGFDADGLREHCRDRLEPPAVPKVFGAVDELPRTASGTVDRRTVVERLTAARDGPAR